MLLFSIANPVVFFVWLPLAALVRCRMLRRRDVADFLLAADHLATNQRFSIRSPAPIGCCPSEPVGNHENPFHLQIPTLFDLNIYPHAPNGEMMFSLVRFFCRQERGRPSKLNDKETEPAPNVAYCYSHPWSAFFSFYFKIDLNK